MGRLGDRLGEFDDDSAIYRADDPAHKVDWRRMAVAYVIGIALAALLIAGADRLFDQPVGGLASPLSQCSSDSLHPLAAPKE